MNLFKSIQQKKYVNQYLGFVSLLLIALFTLDSFAQKIVPYNENKEFKIHFNESGSQYVKLTFLNQVWARYNESNPGSAVYGTPKSTTYDIGLRRTRIQLFGQLTDRVFFYTQFGQNNIAYNSPRKQGLFFLDAVTEYAFVKRALSIGGGLTGWNGLTRYAAPSVGTILSADAPLYQQATNDISDQFLRKFSLYAKGKIGKLDYRMVLSNPMSIQKASVGAGAFGKNASFSTLPGKAQLHGYFNYQFKDEESNLTPYTVGSYLGKKEIFNIGAGFLVQQDAMWRAGDNNDTLFSNIQLLSADVFYEIPLNKEKKTAYTLYAAYQNSDYGKNYYRNVGPMNPATDVTANASLNGPGSAYPIIGTGNTLFAQTAYLFRQNLLGEHGTLQPYVNVQYSQYEAMKDPMTCVDLGVNWLIDGHRAKMSLNLQNRPVFNVNALGDNVVTTRKNMVYLQYQITL